MIRRDGRKLALVIGGVAALVAAGCAAMPAGKAMVGSGDPVADRQRLMKLNGASARDIQDKVKAGNIEAVAVNAETLALNARHIPSLFPAGSRTDKSNAKPEIWQQWAEFESKARNLETWAIRLRDAAQAKNADAVQNIVKDFGRETCGACHTPFRVPPRT